MLGMNTHPHRYDYSPDLCDFRDHAFADKPVVIPRKVDLRPGCSAIKDQGQLGSCHDADTEVLTDQGWRLFSNLNGSERLASVNPKSSELIFEVPTRLTRFPYSGPLHCASGESVNFRVTPDHNMLVLKWNEAKRTLDSDFQLTPMKDIGWYCGLMNRVAWKGEVSAEVFTLPGVSHKHMPQRMPRDVPMRAWLRFLGIYIAEGTMLKRNQREGKTSYKIQIAASKEREKEFARQVFCDIGVHALELSDRFTFENRQIYEAMESIGLLGVKAGKKQVPAFIFKLGADMVAEFLAGHFAGDGCEQRGSRCHYTGSSQLADDLQLLAFMSGQESRISVRSARTSMMADGRTVCGSLPEHRISICERKNLSLDRKSQITIEQYDGEVFCAEVPTHHTLVTRREGKILISGNCTGNSLAGAVEFELRKAGKNPPDLSRLFIYYSERAIEHTTRTDSGAQLRDGIKALASLGVCPESHWPYLIDKFTHKPDATDYKLALPFKISKYARLTTRDDMINCLASGFPFVFGFTVYASFEGQEVAQTGIVPMPQKSEQMLGGHAVYAVGYDLDTDRVLVANSWGTDWGQGGFFTIPFAYLCNTDLCEDFWKIRA